MSSHITFYYPPSYPRRYPYTPRNEDKRSPEEEREKKKEKYKNILRILFISIAILAIAMISVYILTIFLEETPVPVVGEPRIEVTDVAISGYLSGLDYRAKVTVELYNYGNADGIATVEICTIWGGVTRDCETETAFVPVGTTIHVTADLDATAWEKYRAKARVIHQRRA